jgi:conjugal transfer pilus assembly protein TraL
VIYQIPRRHDDPPKLLLWDFDQALIFMLFLVMGLLSDMLVSSFVLGILAAKKYSRIKAGKHRMFLIHLMYWHLPSEMILGIKALPPSATREFIG